MSAEALCIRLVGETHYEDRVILEFSVLGRPKAFLAKYLKEFFGARLMSVNKVKDLWYIQIEYPSEVAKMIIERPRHTDLRVSSN